MCLTDRCQPFAHCWCSKHHACSCNDRSPSKRGNTISRAAKLRGLREATNPDHTVRSVVPRYASLECGVVLGQVACSACVVLGSGHTPRSHKGLGGWSDCDQSLTCSIVVSIAVVGSVCTCMTPVTMLVQGHRSLGSSTLCRRRLHADALPRGVGVVCTPTLSHAASASFARRRSPASAMASMCRLAWRAVHGEYGLLRPVLRLQGARQAPHEVPNQRRSGLALSRVGTSRTCTPGSTGWTPLLSALSFT